MFKMTLSQFGVDELEVKGKPFDPHSMDAINEEVREGVAPGTVIEEIEGGYKMGDKILKASKVIVAK
jgi:molecular chaperone GrpE